MAARVAVGIKHLGKQLHAAQFLGQKQADFDAIATELGYKDAAVARVRWNQVRSKKFPAKKRGPNAPAGGVDKVSPGKKTPVKAKKAGQSSKTKEDGVETPTPKKRANKSKDTGKESTDDDDLAVKSEVQVKEEEVDLAEDDEADVAGKA
nr:hypothetical protein CFP56_33728 [Quercus suber]